MNCFRVFNDVDDQVIGKYPQIDNPVYSKGYNSPFALGNLSFQRSNIDTDIPEATVVSKAKLLDYMSASFLGNQPYLSKKLLDIFKTYSLYGIEFFPAVLHYKKKKIEDYTIMNCYEAAFHLLDYSRCEFAYMDSMLRVIQQYVQFDNSKQLDEAFEQNKKDAITIGYPNHRPLVITSIAFNSTCNVDLFAVKGCSYRYNGLFVSEQLKDKIVEAGCTGMIFKALNESPY